MTFDDANRAIKRADVIWVRQYLNAGLDPNLSNKHGWTLLMIAALEGNTVVGGELIRHGASLDGRNGQGWTALSYAAFAGHPGFIEMLLKAGASLDGHPFGASFEDFLEWSSRYGQAADSKERMRLLVESARTGQLKPHERTEMEK